MLQTLNNPSHPEIWKPAHSCSHVLRARNNAHRFMDLLEQFNLVQFSDDERTLLALAMIYHDAAAEDVSKQDEEQRSAYYFKRDLAGMFPQALLEKVTLALESKEDDVHGINEQGMDKQLRSYIRVLRFGDRMDFIRCAEIGPDFPDFVGNGNARGFDPQRLDLPPEKKADFTSSAPEHKTAFQRHLEAYMHGAADLASVTGGYHRDLRKKSTYERYQLAPDNNKLKRSFEQSTKPLTRINRFIDDNVRRKIADMSGIHTCSDLQHHRHCGSDTSSGITHGIHNSWHDLKQIRVPACMTPLERMQCDHDISVLSETSCQAINKEVQRLKEKGIAMSLGTLTQKTLKSPAATKVLEQRGFSVIGEKRTRGYLPTGAPRLQDMLVPVMKIDPEEPAKGSCD